MGGYRRCADQSCPNRCGQGKVFRRFPTGNEDLAQEWLKRLPASVKLTNSAALCEDHFHASQFERLREDGKGKLKELAVPFLEPCSVNNTVSKNTPRKPFHDITNEHSNNGGDITAQDGASEAEAATALLSLITSGVHKTENTVPIDPHQQPQHFSQDTTAHSHSVGDVTNDGVVVHSQAAQIETNDPEPSFSFEDEDILIECAAVIHSTPKPKSVVQSYLAVNHEESFLNEETGQLICIPHQRPSSEGDTPVDRNTLLFPIDHDTVLLHEDTGDFVYPLQTTVDSDDLLHPSLSILSSSNSISQDSNQTDKNSEEFERLLSLLKQQQAEIENLKAINEAKENKISTLLETGDFSGHFKRKYESERKARERLQKKVKTFHFPSLSESQIERLQRKTSKGMPWTTEEIREGLLLKMKCGTSGYSEFVKRYPLLPSVRSLQTSVQFIRFDSGMLHEIFDMMETVVKSLPDIERDCVVVADELAVQPGEKFDNSLKKWVGGCTLPTHSGLATRALVVLLAGVARRWKVAVHVEFTNRMDEQSKRSAKNHNGNPTGEAYANIINAVVTRAEKAGLRVCAVTSDMGPDNLAYWRACGITGSKKEEVKSSYLHPAREGVVHLMKSVKSMLETNVTITLPPQVVSDHNLPSAVVDYRHIEKLMEFESGSELKVAFRLREENIHCKKQFKTMNVGTTKAVLCHRTGVGLKMLAEEKKDKTYETTAWFVIYLNTFFALATCRSRGLAISKANLSAYEKAINVIKTMDVMFTNMKVGEKGTWKPVQRGMRVLCTSYLRLIDYFLECRGFRYLMLGRFTSDCIENLFSLIRLCQAVPSCSDFLQCLKVVTLAQVSEAVKGASYDYEECVSVPSVDFLEEAREKAKQRAMVRFEESLEELMANPVRKLTSQDYSKLGPWERSVIYDMAGSVIAAIVSSNMIVCESCLHAVKWHETLPHPASVVTELKEYTILRSDTADATSQIAVSEAVFQAILTAEITFRLYRERTVSFKSTDVKQFFVESLMYVWSRAGIPNCHQMGRKILNVFLDGRLKEYGKIRREEAKKRKHLSAPARVSQCAKLLM